MIKSGDKVKFLNETGGGIVTKIQGNIVYVTIEDGFEIPVRVQEVVKMDPAGLSEKFFDQDFNIPPRETSEEIPETYSSSSDHLGNKARQQLPGGLYIAFVPQDQQYLITGAVTVWLLNNTPYELIYTLFFKTAEAYEGFDYGNIPSFCLHEIQTTSREQLEYFGSIVIQALYYSEKFSDIPEPLHKEIKIKTSRFLRESNYMENPVFSDKAFILKFTENPSDAATESIKTSGNKTELLVNEKPFISSFINDDGIAVVDLHIEVICEKHHEMQGHEKMKYQLDYLLRCLESGIQENIHKIIFIHGVGAGILKMEIRKLLEEYDNIEFYDASIAKYGIGATEVNIFRSKK